MDYVFVGFGGVCGTISRFLISKVVAEKVRTTFPVGTLVVNISGTFFLCLLLGLGANNEIIGKETGLALTTGVLGAYTTFSTFSYETVRLLQGGELFRAFRYVLSTVVFGLVTAWLGFLTAFYLV